MAVSPPPVKDPYGTQRWIDWFIKVNQEINIVFEDHNNLGSIQGGQAGQRFHLTQSQHSTLTGIALNGHNSLTSIQGGSAGERFHLTEDQHDDLTGAALVVPEYTVAGAPAPGSFQGGIIAVSNETGGYVLAFSDGSDWRRVTDRAVIST